MYQDCRNIHHNCLKRNETNKYSIKNYLKLLYYDTYSEITTNRRGRLALPWRHRRGPRDGKECQ